MSRVKKRPGVAAGPNRKSNYTRENKPDLPQTQSPWADVPVDNTLEVAVRRAQADTDRLEATCADDAAYFDANPHRSFAEGEELSLIRHVRSETGDPGNFAQAGDRGGA